MNILNKHQTVAACKSSALAIWLFGLVVLLLVFATTVAAQAPTSTMMESNSNEVAVLDFTNHPFFTHQNRVSQISTAQGDVYTTTRNTTLVIAAPGVLTNDGGGTVVTKTTATTHGTVDLRQNGSFTYVPALNYVGDDTFTYTNNATSATVTIHVVPLVSDISLASGWNLFGYPLQGTRPIATALSSIEGKYYSVWSYVSNTWKLYSPAIPSRFNTLDVLTFGEGYRIWMTATATLKFEYITPTVRSAENEMTINMPPAPAAYYGTVRPSAVSPVIQAVRNGVVLAQATLYDEAGELSYMLIVPDAGQDNAVPFAITLNGVEMAQQTWDNTVFHEMTLPASVPTTIALMDLHTSYATSIGIVIVAMGVLAVVTFGRSLQRRLLLCVMAMGMVASFAVPFAFVEAQTPTPESPPAGEVWFIGTVSFPNAPNTTKARPLTLTLRRSNNSPVYTDTKTITTTGTAPIDIKFVVPETTVDQAATAFFTVPNAVATAISYNLPGVITGNVALVNVTFQLVPDVTVSKSVDNSSPKPLDTVRYTVVITNSGEVTATNMVISDVLPTGLSYVGTPVPVQTIPDGSSVTFTYQARVDRGQKKGTVLTNKVTISNDNVTETPNDPAAPISTTASLTVANAVPDLTVISPSVTVNEGITATNSGTITDLNNDAITFTASTGSVTPPTNSYDGTWTWKSDADDTQDGDSNQTVTITATDVNQTVDVITFTLDVKNVAPTAVADSFNTNEDSIMTTADVTLNDTDPAKPFDTLTVASFSTVGTKGLVTQTGNAFTYNPNGQFEAWAQSETTTDTFTYTVKDEEDTGSSATVTINIAGVNDAPTVLAASADVTIDEGALVTRTGSFADVDHGAQVTVTTNIGTIDDANVYTWTWRYTPPDGPVTRTVVVTATDQYGATVTDSFVLTVLNVAPTAVADSFYTNEDSITTTADVTLNDTDPANTYDTLSVSAFGVNGTKGVVTQTGNAFTYNPNGKFEAWAQGQTTTDTFTYTVKDSDDAIGSSATVTIIITGVNDAPTVLSASADVTITEGALVTRTGSFADVDHSAQVTVTTNIGEIDNANVYAWTWHHTPPDGLVTQTVVVTATDQYGATVTDSFVLTVLNVNPVATDNSYTTKQGQPVRGNVMTDGVPDSDVGSDTLSVDSGTFTTTNKRGTVIMMSNGSFVYSPEPKTILNDSFVYTLRDEDGGVATATVTLYITPTQLSVVLNPTWDLFGYPLLWSQPITQALRTIATDYSIVWGFTNPDTWSFYCQPPSACTPQPGTLKELAYAQGYWIKLNGNNPVTVTFSLTNTRSADTVATSLEGGLGAPPAVFYGLLEAGEIYTPQSGQAVEAYIDNTLCGTSETFDYNGAVWYQTNVLSNDSIGNCGVNGADVNFVINGTRMEGETVWQFGELINAGLHPAKPTSVALSQMATPVSSVLAVFSALFFLMTAQFVVARVRHH